MCAEEQLVAHGFHRYEVASYARAGFECEHNKMYWTGKPYLGVGHAAVSMKQNDASRVRFSDGCVQEVRPRMSRRSLRILCSVCV